MRASYMFGFEYDDLLRYLYERLRNVSRMRILYRVRRKEAVAIHRAWFAWRNAYNNIPAVPSLAHARRYTSATGELRRAGGAASWQSRIATFRQPDERDAIDRNRPQPLSILGVADDP